MHTGKPPFSHIKRPVALITEVLIKKKKPPRPSTDSLSSRRLWDLVDSCLSHGAEERPTIDSLLSSLKSPEIYALIIGINKYSKYNPLTGAVQDALDFKKYLRETQDSSENIKLLLDGDATRAAIVQEIQSLKTNDAIKKNDTAIIIFYAGYGASSPMPDGWPEWQFGKAGVRIEQLCPVDIGETVSDKVIEGIPDYDIRVWLDELSQAKGNNITVILDCCHSGGMNRDSRHDIGPDWVSRCIDQPPELSLPSNPLDYMRSVVPGTGRDSHILVAACNRTQCACESQGRGHFTTALLKVLREYSLESLTYKTLMDLLEMPRHNDAKAHQNPHCDGKFIRRRLFDTRVPMIDANLILCYRSGETYFTLHAGAIHGVTVGSEYEILGLDFAQVSRITTKATVETVKPFTSILWLSADSEMPSASASDGHFRNLWYARLSKEAGQEVRLYCSDKAYLQRLIAIDDGLPVTTSETPTDADMVLTLTDTHVSFDRGSKTLIVEPDIGYPSLLYEQVDKDDLAHVRYVVKSYTRFLRHLTRTGPMPNEQDIIKLSLHRLERPDWNMHPAGEDLLHGNPGVIMVSQETYYGLTLINLSDVRLFAYVIYFYPGTGEITLWYSARQGAGAINDPDATLFDAALEPKQVLGPGFGNGGVPPFSFSRPEHQSIDVSLLKVFVTATPTDMTSLVQSSAFDNDALRMPTMRIPRDMKHDFWVTKTITIVEKDVNL